VIEMKKITLSLIFILTCFLGYSQNLIGLNSTQIREYMKENRKDMNLNDVINSTFKYLKYTDNSDTQTILYFLNDDSVCSSVRMIWDFSLKTEKMKELNSRYKKVDENRWSDRKDGKNYRIIVKDEKWAFNVTIEPDI